MTQSNKTRNSLWAVVLLLMLAALVMSACSDDGAEGSGLPDLPPTITAVPPSTPTAIPQERTFDLPDVDWNDVDKFRVAMRDEFKDDIDQFVDANRYYIEGEITFEAGVAIANGAELVRYTNHSNDTLDQIVFRLYPNMVGSGGVMFPKEPGLDKAI